MLLLSMAIPNNSDHAAEGATLVSVASPVTSSRQSCAAKSSRLLLRCGFRGVRVRWKTLLLGAFVGLGAGLCGIRGGAVPFVSMLPLRSGFCGDVVRSVQGPTKGSWDDVLSQRELSPAVQVAARTVLDRCFGKPLALSVTRLRVVAGANETSALS